MKKPYAPKASSPELQAQVDRFYSHLDIESELVLDPLGFIVRWYQYGKPISGPYSFDYSRVPKMGVEA